MTGDSEEKHTAGKWLFEGPDMFGDYNILHPADSLAVAAVVSNMRPGTEVRANARLIAAAPDLLAALQAAMEVFGELTSGKPGESVLPVYSRILSVGAQGRAAISLATQDPAHLGKGEES